MYQMVEHTKKGYMYRDFFIEKRNDNFFISSILVSASLEEQKKAIDLEWEDSFLLYGGFKPYKKKCFEKWECSNGKND